MTHPEHLSDSQESSTQSFKVSNASPPESESEAEQENKSNAMLRDLPLQKRIFSPEDVASFRRSSVFDYISQTLLRLCQSIANCDNKAVTLNVNNLEKLPHEQILDVLEKVSLICQNTIPAERGNSRFGNLAYRSFFDTVRERSESYITDCLGIKDPEHVKDCAQYLAAAFGDRERIDYGSGHELNFFCFLICLYKINYLPQNTESDRMTVLIVFRRYISLMRDLEFKFWLEPAGSHGVWGLDDYHFLPFVFGAWQLRDHPHLRPLSIHDRDVVEALHKNYMYFDCIYLLYELKPAAPSLRWHSPMLDDISAAKSWVKVADGMLKMYDAEVLGKLPIMQHFMFGKILNGEGIGSNEPKEKSTVQRAHACNHWSDCCGIAIPSVIAAAEAERAEYKQTRRIPFD